MVAAMVGLSLAVSGYRDASGEDEALLDYLLAGIEDGASAIKSGTARFTVTNTRSVDAAEASDGAGGPRTTSVNYDVTFQADKYRVLVTKRVSPPAEMARRDNRPTEYVDRTLYVCNGREVRSLGGYDGDELAVLSARDPRARMPADANLRNRIRAPLGYDIPKTARLIRRGAMENKEVRAHRAGRRRPRAVAVQAARHQDQGSQRVLVRSGEGILVYPCQVP